jgi:hypothetical protein
MESAASMRAVIRVPGMDMFPPEYTPVFYDVFGRRMVQRIIADGNRNGMRARAKGRLGVIGSSHELLKKSNYMRKLLNYLKLKSQRC